MAKCPSPGSSLTSVDTEGPVWGRCGPPLGPSVPPGVGCLLGRQGPACYHTAVAEATEQRAARESIDRGWLRSSPRRSSRVQPPDRLDPAPLSRTSDTSQLLWLEGCRFESHSLSAQGRRQRAVFLAPPYKYYYIFNQKCKSITSTDSNSLCNHMYWLAPSVHHQ